MALILFCYKIPTARCFYFNFCNEQIEGNLKKREE
jgi:hypothetical protein